MPSFAAPGGAYHFRHHKWGARREAAWRQSVKDYGGYDYNVRRRKAHITTNENSDAAPVTSGSFITVGERWNGRGEAVDIYLEDLANSPNERREAWNIVQCDGVLCLSVTLNELRVENRQTLQYHFNLNMTLGCGLSTLTDLFYAEFRKRSTYSMHNTLMTEESRENAWQSVKIAIGNVIAELTQRVRQWERDRRTFLATAGVNSVRDAVLYRLTTGELIDASMRFKISWTLPGTVLEQLQFRCTIQLTNEPFNQVLAYCFNPLILLEQLTTFIDNLPMAAPIQTIGRRIISDE